MSVWNDIRRRAAAAADPGFTARGVAGQLVYAVGDVHGRHDLLEDLLRRIARDYGPRACGRRPVLVFCGDYVDRGPDSARVLETLVWLRRRPELDVRLLKGNHEDAMLGFLESPERAVTWMEFGGAQTLVSYGVEPPRPEEGVTGYVRARDELVGRMPASHLRLLDTLDLLVVIGDYAFVHAGVHPARPLLRQKEHDLLWIRSPFLDARGGFEKIVVHGHTWVDDKPQLLGWRIGVDTGGYATGVLTALRLQDGEADFLQARAAALTAAC